MADDNELDPSANTAMFQAFVDRDEPEQKSWRKPAAAIFAVLALLVIVLTVVYAVA